MVDPRRYVTPSNPQVQALARSFKNAREAFEWVKGNIAYVLDPQGLDFWQMPLETIQRAAGDCEDIACLLTSILRAMGYDAYCRILKSPVETFAHAITTFKCPLREGCRNQWIDLDASQKALPFGAIFNSHYRVVAQWNEKIVRYY